MKISGKIASMCSSVKPYRSVTQSLMGRITGTHVKKATLIKQASDIDIGWSKEYIRYQLETYRYIKAAQSASDIDDLVFCGICQNTVE